MTRNRFFTGAWLHVLLGALVLSSAAFVYGRPFIFHDSGTYYVYGEHIVSEIAAAVKGTSAAIIPLGEAEQDYVGARSPTYSLLLYLATASSTLWGVVGLQAVVASWVLFALTRSVAPDRVVAGFWTVVVVLVLGSPLSYFVSYAMPDVFAGIGALALIAILLCRRRLRPLELVGFCLVLVASASFHPTLPPVFGAAALVGIAVAALADAGARRQLVTTSGLVGACLIIGAVLPPAYRAIEQRVHPIAAPPFAMARILADGTGVAHLADVCLNPDRFALCRIPLELPVDSDSFLWSQADNGGGYLAVDAATRAKLRAEEQRFVLSVILARPWEQLRISLGHWADQMALVDVWEPLFDPETQTSYRLFALIGAAPGQASNFVGEPALSILRHIVLALSVAGIATLSVFAARSDDPRIRQGVVLVAVLATLVVVNAAVCGMISRPYPRYQARLIWILPATLALIGLWIASRSSSESRNSARISRSGSPSGR